MAAKANEGGPEEASRKVASGGKGKNRAVRRKSDRLLVSQRMWNLLKAALNRRERRGTQRDIGQLLKPLRAARGRMDAPTFWAKRPKMDK